MDKKEYMNKLVKDISDLRDLVDQLSAGFTVILDNVKDQEMIKKVSKEMLKRISKD